MLKKLNLLVVSTLLFSILALPTNAQSATFSTSAPESGKPSSNIVITGTLTNTAVDTVRVGNCNMFRSATPSKGFVVLQPVSLTISAPTGTNTLTGNDFGGATQGEFPITTEVNGERPPITTGQSVTFTATVTLSNELVNGDKVNVYYACVLLEDNTGYNSIGSSTSNTKSISIVAEAPTSTPKPSPTKEQTKPTPTPQEEEEDDDQTDLVSLPSKFKGETTDLSELTKEELSEVRNFILDNGENTKVRFKDTLDFSDEDTIELLKNLDDYVTLGDDFVEIDSDEIEILDSEATITMENIEVGENEEVIILKDGKEADEDEVTSMNYDEDDKTLVFDVSGFSRYEVEIRDAQGEVPNEDEPVEEEEGSSSPIIFIIIAIVILAGIGGGAFFYMKKKKAKKIEESVKSDQKETEETFEGEEIINGETESKDYSMSDDYEEFPIEEVTEKEAVISNTEISEDEKKEDEFEPPFMKEE